MSLRGRIREGLRDPESKRRYVRDLFGRIAHRYDLTNDVMSLGLHRRWKERVLEVADLRPGHRVLDLAAGTGDLALGAAPAVAAGPDGPARKPSSRPSREPSTGPAGRPSGGPARRGLVVAADLTPRMMQVGRRRAEEARLAGAVRWVCGDALRLPFGDAGFDRVLIGYGLRNFPDLEESLVEILRVLAPGGRLVALDFGKPRIGALRAGYLAYLDLSTRAVGWLLHRDPEAYAYIPESLRRYPGQRGVAAMMGRLGYVRRGFLEFMAGAMAVNWGERPSDPTAA